MRCLGFAELDRDVVAREFHDPDAPPSDELHSDYVVHDQLQLSTWARDAVALELPDQILCRDGLRRALPRVREGSQRRAARAPRARPGSPRGPRSKGFCKTGRPLARTSRSQ